MSTYTIPNATLDGCSIVLGENRRTIDDEPEHYNHDQAQLHRLKNIIGMDTRYIVANGTTTCDLCTQAAQTLMQALHLAPDSIGTIIFVTQTPDYLIPGNAHLLHARLGFGVDTSALDVTMGCSGFIYGLWLAAMTASFSQKKVLLLAGDTLSTKAHPQDSITAPLFGDAGSATVISHTPQSTPMHFVMYTEGASFKNGYIPAGGARMPSTPETRIASPDAKGNLRSAENLHLDGFGIFSFTMTKQPQLLKAILRYSDKNITDIDYFLLHQANRHIVETIAKKSGIPAEKVPADIFSRFGNQNAASIPGTLCGSLADTVQGRSLQVVMQGYGVGLSWGACQLELKNALCLPPVCHTASLPIP